MTNIHKEINELLKNTKYVLVNDDNRRALILKDVELDELVKGNYYSIKNGTLPSSYSALDKQSYFTKKCNLIHNYKFSYSKAVFNTLKDYIYIICSTHGLFKQTLGNHLNGQGCKKCYGTDLKTTV